MALKVYTRVFEALLGGWVAAARAGWWWFRHTIGGI